MHLFCDPATSEDAETVATLCGEMLRRAFRRAGNNEIPHALPLSPLKALEWLEAGEHEVLLSRLDQDIVGMAVAKTLKNEDDEPYGVIEGLYLRPQYRDLGLRRVMLSSLARHARGLGWQRLEVIAQSVAAKADPMSFYEANGYAMGEDRAVKTIVLAPCTCRRHSGLHQHPH